MTAKRGYAILVVPLKGFIFLCKNLAGQPFRPSLSETDSRRKDLERSSFLREAKQSDYTGGAEHEGKSDFGLRGVQAAQLQHDEEQEKRSRSPKAGTVTPDVAKAVTEAKAGKIEYRLDKTNIIHCPIGKASFGAEKLQENFDALMNAIVKAKPAASKGQYVKSCVVATTMGPGVRINPIRYGA